MGAGRRRGGTGRGTVGAISAVGATIGGGRVTGGTGAATGSSTGSGSAACSGSVSGSGSGSGLLGGGGRDLAASIRGGAIAFNISNTLPRFGTWSGSGLWLDSGSGRGAVWAESEALPAIISAASAICESVIFPPKIEPTQCPLYRLTRQAVPRVPVSMTLDRPLSTYVKGPFLIGWER